MASYYQRAADQHRGFERQWKESKESWLEQTLGRLAGTYHQTVAIAGFHGTVAAQFELLEQGHGNARQAAQLEDCIGRVMQHAAYHCDACKGIVTIDAARKSPQE